MIAIWMLFAIVSGGLLTIGAFAAERFAQTLKLPTRLVWILAIAATTVWPVITGIGAVQMSANKAHAPNSVKGSAVHSAAPSIDAFEKNDDSRDMVRNVSSHIYSVPASPIMPSAVSAQASGLTASQMLANMRTLDARMILGPRARMLNLWLLTGWAILSLVFASRLIYALIVLRKHRRTWQHVQIDGFTVRLSQNAGPAVVGVRHPEVVLPEWVLHFEPALRALIVQHEREHQIARDPMLLFCMTVLRVVFPWNLALALQMRRLQLAVEVDCDSRVLQQHPQQERYGLLLLAIAQHRANGPFRLSPALVESHTHLERRIIVMRNRNTRTSRLRAVAFGTAAIGGAVLAGYVTPPSNAFAMTVAEIRSIPAKGSAVNDLQSVGNTSKTKLTAERQHNPSTVATRASSDVPRRATTERHAHNPISVKNAADSIPKKDSTPAPPSYDVWIRNPGDTSKKDPSKNYVEVHWEHAAAVDTRQRKRVRPIYPDSLRAARVEGEVRAQFIVDTTGYMLPGSLKVLSSTNQLFTNAVREALPRMKFTPARADSKKFQQLVELPFSFTITSAAPATPPSVSPKAPTH